MNVWRCLFSTLVPNTVKFKSIFCRISVKWASPVQVKLLLVHWLLELVVRDVYCIESVFYYLCVIFFVAIISQGFYVKLSVYSLSIYIFLMFTHVRLDLNRKCGWVNCICRNIMLLYGVCGMGLRAASRLRWSRTEPKLLTFRSDCFSSIVSLWKSCSRSTVTMIINVSQCLFNILILLSLGFR